MKKTIKCRGGKISRFFISMVLVPLIVFMSWNWDERTVVAYNNEPVFSIVEPLSLIESPEKSNFNTISNSYSVSSLGNYSYINTASTYNNSRSTINIMGRTINVFDSNDTKNDAGFMVARFINKYYPGKFFYGHNSSSVFGGLGNLSTGSTFTITINGESKKYVVAINDIVKNDEKLANDMSNIAMARHNGVSYSVSLMTCAGVSYDGNNATHRIIVFANEV